ncbi:PAS domain-containing protein [Actinokineospora auranticolor]|uniref:PAS domain S-box-containing protein n=1 Tax=Actinokineospora auranticolor TaxID=155976 RepID=A0A2S6GYB4_9PSEU|nr:PAS domain-containing protein [Actinokineospora auranticolor]PPK70198.1 PAS domain S-box-containing protein [Actinokineospora auranticolor]
MRQSTIQVTGVERKFGANELIVTKTDPKGVITYANDVFLRISAFTEDEVIGKPHNVIRHPDMPKTLFKLLWDTVSARRELFAYVLNLAGDGAQYWVLAHVTASFDDRGSIVGYHSNRRSPSPRAVTEAKAVYDRVLAAERATAGRDALVAGERALRQELGGSSWDEFFWSITPGSTR